MSVRHALVHSLSSATSPETHALRCEEMADISNPARKAAVTALHHTAMTFPRLVARLTGVPNANRWPLTYIRSGYHSTAYKGNDGMVVKILKAKVDESFDNQQKVANKIREENALLASYVGSFTLPQQVVIDRHPISLTGTAVQIIQPFCSGSMPGFQGHDLSRREIGERLAESQSTAPINIAAQVLDLAQAGLELYDSHGYLPDTVGDGNLLLGQDGKLVLVDGQPIGPQEPNVQSSIIRQLNAFRAVSEAALESLAS